MHQKRRGEVVKNMEDRTLGRGGKCRERRGLRTKIMKLITMLYHVDENSAIFCLLYAKCLATYAQNNAFFRRAGGTVKTEVSGSW